MAEARKAAESSKGAAAKESAKVQPPILGPVGESGDARVQELVAQRDIHRMNALGHTQDVVNIDQELADFGY